MSEKSELLTLWLEKLIENHQEGGKLSVCTIGNDKLRTCYDRDKRIQMFNCITKMADWLGIPIMEDKFIIDGYWLYEYGFWFNGYYFFETTKKKEGLKTIPYSEEKREETT